MGCFVPFNNRNLDISLFAFRPMVVFVDELLDALKHFSMCTQSLGCVHSAIFRSIHGNMIIWYGAWMKRSNENKELVNATLGHLVVVPQALLYGGDHKCVVEDEFEVPCGGGSGTWNNFFISTRAVRATPTPGWLEPSNICFS